MLLEQHLLQLFGNLPYLPKAAITKHLKEFDLIKAYLVSGNWAESIGSQKNDVARNRRKLSSCNMTSKTDRVELSVLERYGGAMLVIHFPVESVLENSTEIVENEDRVICHSENFKQFENRILATFHKIRTWFDVESCLIRVNLDIGFNLEFLKKLRLGVLDSFELSGDKKRHQIDSKELSDLLNTWEIRSVFIDTIDGMQGTFKRCLLTSEHLNQFFKKWRNAGRHVDTLECHMEHEVDVEKVLEGLEAKKWNPKERGRIFRKRGLKGCTYIDLADGMDIYRSYGQIGTIHISADKKVIRFFRWIEKFPLQTDKKKLIRLIERLKPKLEQFDRSPRELARMAKDIEDYEAKLRILNEQIARENQ